MHVFIILKYSGAYDILDFKMVNFYSGHFLQCYSLTKYREIVNLKLYIITMSLQTLDNAVDCGVYVMRHLEWYMGKTSAWSSGLRSAME